MAKELAAAVEAGGRRLAGIRLDSGDVVALARLARERLDAAGLHRRRRLRQRRARRVRDRPPRGRRRPDRRLRGRHQLRHLGRRPDTGERLQAGGRRRAAHGQALDRARPRCPAPSRSGAGRASAATSSGWPSEPVPAPGAEPLLVEVDLGADAGRRRGGGRRPGSVRGRLVCTPVAVQGPHQPHPVRGGGVGPVTSLGRRQLRPRMTARNGPVPI